MQLKKKTREQPPKHADWTVQEATTLTTDTQPRAGIASLTDDRLLNNLLPRFFSRNSCDKTQENYD